MSENFEITYENDDGYVGSRPHYTEIGANELDEDMDESELRSIFWDAIKGDFESSHYNLTSEQEDEFVAWAKEHIAKMKAE